MTTTHRHRWRRVFWWSFGITGFALLSGNALFFFTMLLIDGSIAMGWSNAKN